MTTAWVKSILIIAVIGQFFCGMSCMTSASRMMYAFSRDGAVPGLAALEPGQPRQRVPFNAVMAVAVLALILTLPALKGNRDGVTVAFTAVVSIGVIGLYVAYVIPIFLRWRRATRSSPARGRSGSKYKWMAPIALLEVIIVVVIYFNLPFSSSGVPWEDDFDWSLVQLHAGGHRRPVRDRRPLVGGQREEAVHRPAAHDRVRSTRDRREGAGRAGTHGE